MLCERGEKVGVLHLLRLSSSGTCASIVRGEKEKWTVAEDASEEKNELGSSPHRTAELKLRLQIADLTVEKHTMYKDSKPLKIRHLPNNEWPLNTSPWPPP